MSIQSLTGQDQFKKDLTGCTGSLKRCGGAFDGIEKIIGSRTGKQGLGFGAQISSKKESNINELLGKLIPQDLLKFGLIPEFIGRLPVFARLDKLDRKRRKI